MDIFRLGREIQELISNSELSRFVTIKNYDFEEMINDWIHGGVFPTLDFTLGEEKYDFFFSCKDFLHPPILTFEKRFSEKIQLNNEGVLDMFDEEWSPALMTSHWLLMIIHQI